MNPRRPRWKLLLVLLALPIGLRALLPWTPFEEAGFGGFASILVVAALLLLALVWLLLLSGLSARHRLIGFAIFLLLGVAFRFSVRVEGHMGDFFPQLAWIWTPSPEARADALDLSEAGMGGEAASISPNDFPRFLGPEASNWIPGSALADGWHGQTPRELWRRNIGLGWSSFSVAGGRAITMEQRGDDELTVCYAARTGDPLWVHTENARFTESMGGIGPRSTPTIHQDKVYALGATGILVCLNLSDGQHVWRRDTLEEAGHGTPTWAKSCSPMIVDDLVVITLGSSRDGSLAAYDLQTGEPRWRAGDDKPSYATPIVATLAGQRQIVSFNAASVSGHNIDSGTMLWKQKLSGASAHNATPVIINESQVLVGIGYGRGCHLLEIEKNESTLSVSEVWHSNKMKPKFADMVPYEGYLYGLDEGRLVCLELAEGRRAWRGTRFKHGQLLGVGDKLLIQAESGDIVIAEASPDDETIIHRFDALSSKTWNHPVLAGQLLLVRNDREAIAFEYPGRG